MRPIPFISTVLVSFALLAGAATGRPRYGGTLRLETRALVRNLDPADEAVDPLESAAKNHLLSQVFETLVRLDEKGQPQPLLAESWTHDTARRRWIFHARKRVIFHNGAAWSPTSGEVYVPDDRPIEQILRDLSRLKNAIALRTSDGAVVGTGPFKVAKFEPGKSLLLSAHEQHWAGRPFLDGVAVLMGRSFRDQAQDAQLGQADITELPVGDVRRARQRGDLVTLSAPVETLALVFDRVEPPPVPVREAMSLALDRASIQSVLLQKMGEPSAALLPQWLSGHAVAFPAERNLARARKLGSGSPPMSFHYDRQDALLHAIGERIALDESECGISLRVDGPGPIVRLAWLRFTIPNPDLALDEIAASLGMTLERKPDPFERESALLDGFSIVPIVQVSVAYTLNPRVQGWMAAPWIATDRWDLANIWLAEAAS